MRFSITQLLLVVTIFGLAIEGIRRMETLEEKLKLDLSINPACVLTVLERKEFAVLLSLKHSEDKFQLLVAHLREGSETWYIGQEYSNDPSGGLYSRVFDHAPTPIEITLFKREFLWQSKAQKGTGKFYACHRSWRQILDELGKRSAASYRKRRGTLIGTDLH